MCKWAIFRTANSANQRTSFFSVTPDWLNENKNVENQICNDIKTFKFLSTKLNFFYILTCERPIKKILLQI